MPSVQAMLNQDQVWGMRGDDGAWQDVKLASLGPDHLVNLRDWLERTASRWAAPGLVDPLGWMRQTPLYQRVARLIECPWEEGALVAEVLTQTDLKVVRKYLNRALDTAGTSEADKSALRRVLWKVGAVQRGEDPVATPAATRKSDRPRSVTKA